MYIQGAFHTSALIVLWGAANTAEKTETSLSSNRHELAGKSGPALIWDHHAVANLTTNQQESQQQPEVRFQHDVTTVSFPSSQGKNTRKVSNTLTQFSIAHALSSPVQETDTAKTPTHTLHGNCRLVAASGCRVWMNSVFHA